MSPQFTDCDNIAGVIVKRPERFADRRGWLMEFFRHDEMEKANQPAMGYLSITEPGLSRGPHEHVEQTDMFFFAGPGEFLVALWDNREASPTFRKRMVVMAGESAPCTLVVPPGVVHAYSCVSNTRGTIINVPNRLYCGEGRRENVDEVRHEDDPKNPFLVDLKLLLEESVIK